MKFPRPFLAPEDGGGAPPPAPPAGGSPSVPAPPGGTDAAPPAPSGDRSAQTLAPYRPEGLPDHLLGATDRETIDKVYGAYKPARETISTLGDVPKDAKGYAIDWADPVKPYADTLNNDAFLNGVKDIALKHRIPGKQFAGFLNDVMAKMVADDMVAEPFSADKETAIILPDVADAKERATQADGVVRGNIALVEAWKGQDMPDAAATFLLSQMDRGAANLLVKWIADRAGEQRPAMNGAAGGAVSEAQLDAMMADPRGTIGDPKYDPTFVRDRDTAFQRAYGYGARA